MVGYAVVYDLSPMTKGDRKVRQARLKIVCVSYLREEKLMLLIIGLLLVLIKLDDIVAA